ncbi:MAG TPA: hypothetical protein VNX68_17375 [Nitrosopumilaceae archaeon]|jgi:N-acetyl-anhydromuramyl-L-alanine amidase AmpD|nr:hypothetical protein [Nitrosopumilaceae archaeon]
MLTLTDNLEISNKNQPIQKFILPNSKKIIGEKITRLTTVVLSISRDAFTLAMAIDRLEQPDNHHARHLIIDRDGSIFQFAKLTQPIYHLPSSCDRRKINNYNSIAIELVTAGKLFYTYHRKIVLHCASNIGEQKLKIARENIKSYQQEASNSYVYYETFYFNQFYALFNLLNLLRQYNTNLRVLDCDRWQDLAQFNLSRSIPRRRLGIEISRY